MCNTSKCAIQVNKVDLKPTYMLTFLDILEISNGIQDDIDCLKSLNGSFEDPYNYLNSSWDFNNNTRVFICKFIGVECWHPDENRVLNLRLSDMGLMG